MRIIKTLAISSSVVVLFAAQVAMAAIPGGRDGCDLVQRTTDGWVCLDL
jgi:hypothetical protein